MDKEIRKIFETFDGKSTFNTGKHGNYTSPDVHNLWVGFKNWYSRTMKKPDSSTDKWIEKLQHRSNKIHFAKNHTKGDLEGNGISYKQKFGPEYVSIRGTSYQFKQLEALLQYMKRYQK